MEIENTASKKLFLLDAYALIYRAYFGFIKNPRFNNTGLNTSAILGFINTLDQLMSANTPTHIAIAFDVHADTFRHEMFPEYKANRETMPEDIRLAIPYIRDIIRAYNIPIIEKEGFEADDVIGTIAKKAELEGFITYMVTPDKDYAQLVTEQTYMYKPPKGGNKAEILGPAEIQENFQITDPIQVIDILGLMGDTADNIPGCPGIGPKTAMKLIADFGSIDGVYEHINQLKGKQKENLINHKEQVYLSRELVIIDREVPVPIDFDEMKKQEPNKQKLLNLFQELDFRTHAAKLNATKPQAPTLDFEQGSLFGAPLAETSQLNSTFGNIDTIKHSYYKVENEMQRASLRAELAVAKSFCFNTLTTDIDIHTTDLISLSFAIKPNEAYCVILPSDQTKAQIIVNEFKLIFEDKNSTKTGHDIKSCLKTLANFGIEVKGTLYDTMIAHYLIEPDLRHTLDYLCEIYLNYKKLNTEDIIGSKGKNQRTLRSLSPEQLVNSACEDTDMINQLHLKLHKELIKNDLLDLFNKIEMPLIPVLVDMETTGVKVEPIALNEYAAKLRIQIIELEKEIHTLAGTEFLISSPKQLGIVLFENLNIDPKAKKTKTKQYSTGEEVLVKLEHKHPIIGKVLAYRGLKKLLNTYVEALPKLINPKTGKIHTSFNQAVAATGRLSSVKPNLQNIPIRDENGREIRKAFIPAEKEMVYLSADYSQIELRIMAALSQDENLLEAFANNLDIHSITASKIFGVPLEEVSADMRRKAKTANFGIIYGISAFGLAQRLAISRSEAKIIIDGYFEAFPKVKEYMTECIENARKIGFVKTLLGRKRYLVEINSSNSIVRGVAERNAINAPIQGSAADIIKIAMIRIHNRMIEEKLKSKMILQVHDELNFDVYVNELEIMKKLVKEEMENAIKIDVPLTVDIDSGSNWLEAH
jgi:DNA polymerase-1